MTDLSPGERIEVVFDSGSVFRRGWLIAISSAGMHCFFDDNNVLTHDTYKPEQVRREQGVMREINELRSIAAVSDKTVPWWKFWHRSNSDVLLGLSLLAGYMESRIPRLDNIAHEIAFETKDGLKVDDPVDIYPTRDGKTTGPYAGRFIAEFRGVRFVVYDNRAPSALPAQDVIPRKAPHI